MFSGDVLRGESEVIGDTAIDVCAKKNEREGKLWAFDNVIEASAKISWGNLWHPSAYDR